MRKTYKIITLSFLIFSLVCSAFGQSNTEKPVVMRAVEDEMKRAMKDLKFNSFDKPYFLEYVVEDVNQLTIQATFGAIKQSRKIRNRILYTQVRVGDYELDNIGQFAFRLPFPMPVDDNYDALRRSVWFVTDRAYKQAINMFEVVKASKRNRTQDDDEKAPSFSKETPIVQLQKPETLEIDKEKWEKQVREWSSIFRTFPQFRESNFNFYIRHVNRYLINSEGARILKPSLLITIDVHAKSVTSDNTVVEPYLHKFATTFDEMPSNETITNDLKDFAKKLEKHKKAKPFKDTYIGPALFTEGASVQLFLQLLSPNLKGGDFTDRIGRKVLPSFLSVIDDPTLAKFGDHKLAGGYEIDDEGVKAKTLTLIENGALKTLLMTRSPNKYIKNSNGRARGSGPRGSNANISNLIVKSKEGKSFAELKKQLIEECKKQGLSYGVIFRENDATFGSFTGSSPVMVYKVYVEDGREELYRDAGIFDLSVRELRNILAAGNDPYPFNLLIGSSYNGSGTPASVVAPSVLLEEIYLKRGRNIREKPKLVNHPFFNKAEITKN